MSVILATQEAEIRRIAVQSQSKQIVHENLSWKKKSQKRAGGVAQGVGPEFKPSTTKNNNNPVIEAGVMVHACNPNTWETEASLRLAWAAYWDPISKNV
jgi:hypothetical protein